MTTGEIVGIVIALSWVAWMLLGRFVVEGLVNHRRARRRAITGVFYAGAFYGDRFDDGLPANAHVSGRGLPPARRAFHSYRRVR